MPEPISTCPSPTFSVQQRCCYHPLHHPKATSALVRTFSKPTWHRGMVSALSQVTGGSLALPSRVFLNSVHAPDQGFCSLFQTLGFHMPPHCSVWLPLCSRDGAYAEEKWKKKGGGGARGRLSDLSPLQLSPRTLSWGLEWDVAMHPACPGQDLPPNTSALTHALQGISISTAVMLLFSLPLNCNSRDVHIPGLVRDHQFSWHYISAAEGSGESRPYDFFF